MGENVPDLKLFENDTVVETWVNLQRQSDLNILNVGLITNRTDLTTAAPTSNNNETTATTAMVNPTGGSGTTMQNTSSVTLPVTSNTNTTPTKETATQGKYMHFVVCFPGIM